MVNNNYCRSSRSRCLSVANAYSSWKTTYTALSQIENASGNSQLRYYLATSEAFDILSVPFAPFPAPSTQTKSSFETKTSAINVPPSPHGRYDIKQVQEDTRWLSKETNIDELSALRIVVLEWQSRPVFSLLKGHAAEKGPKFKQTLGWNSLQLPSNHSQFGSTLSGISNNNPSGEVDSRKARLLNIYLSERRYIIKTCEHLVFAALCRVVPNTENQQPKGQETWIETLGNRILLTWDVGDKSKSSKRDFFVVAVEALQSRLQGLETGSGWLKDESSQEALDLPWTRHQLLEIINVLQIMLKLLEPKQDLTRSDAFLAWFRLMGSCSFFENFEPVSSIPCISPYVVTLIS